MLTATIENWEIALLEKEYLKNKPRISDREILGEIPEAKDSLKEKLAELEKIKKDLEQECKEALKRTYKANLKGFELWFLEKVVEVWYVLPLMEVEHKISRIKWLVFPPKESKNGITENMIERARDYPIEDLIETNKRGFAFCPNHNDKHPSFYIRNGFGYCFSCGYWADSIKLLMEKQNYTFKQAVETLQN